MPHFLLSAAIVLSGAIFTSVAANAGGHNFDHHKYKAHQHNSDWQYQGVSKLAIDSRINHYTWTLKVGDGPYDMVRLHRYVMEKRNKDLRPGRPAPNQRKVLFILNGTWGQEGEEPISQSDTYFFPKNGYDVWTMDYRVSFISNLAYDQFEQYGELEGLMSTANWTYEKFREDAKQAIDFAKKHSRANKVFIAGRSRGGQQAFIYSAKYEDDIKGIIGLDGGPVYQGIEDASKQKSQAEYEAALAATAAGASGPLLSQVFNYEDSRLVGTLPYIESAIGAPIPTESELPFGPAPDGSSINNLADWLAYQSYYLGFPGSITNIYTQYPGGNGETFMDKGLLAYSIANYARYWPTIQNIENTFLEGYADNPYLDYDDTHNVTVPVIHFRGEFGCPAGSCLNQGRPYSTASSDVSVVYLPGFGHLDVYYGTHSTSDVKEPMLDWMNARK